MGMANKKEKINVSQVEIGWAYLTLLFTSFTMTRLMAFKLPRSFKDLELNKLLSVQKLKTLSVKKEITELKKIKVL